MRPIKAGQTVRVESQDAVDGAATRLWVELLDDVGHRRQVGGVAQVLEDRLGVEAAVAGQVVGRPAQMATTRGQRVVQLGDVTRPGQSEASLVGRQLAVGGDQPVQAAALGGRHEGDEVVVDAVAPEEGGRGLHQLPGQRGAGLGPDDLGVQLLEAGLHRLEQPSRLQRAELRHGARQLAVDHADRPGEGADLAQVEAPVGVTELVVVDPCRLVRRGGGDVPGHGRGHADGLALLGHHRHQPGTGGPPAVRARRGGCEVGARQPELRRARCGHAVADRPQGALCFRDPRADLGVGHVGGHGGRDGHDDGQREHAEGAPTHPAAGRCRKGAHGAHQARCGRRHRHQRGGPVEAHRGPAQHDLHGEGAGERAEERIGPARPHAGEGEQQRAERRDQQPAPAHDHGQHAQPQQRPPGGAAGRPRHGGGEQGGVQRIEPRCPRGVGAGQRATDGSRHDQNCNWRRHRYFAPVSRHGGPIYGAGWSSRGSGPIGPPPRSPVAVLAAGPLTAPMRAERFES